MGQTPNLTPLEEIPRAPMSTLLKHVLHFPYMLLYFEARAAQWQLGIEHRGQNFAILTPQ